MNLDYEHPVVIIGAGLSGICMAKKLKDYNINFVILEKESSAGGTWFKNKQLGCKCDITFAYYSYSFFKQIDPKGYQFTNANLIYKYLLNVINRYKLDSYILLNHKVTDITYNNNHQIITINNQSVIKCKHVINAIGQLDQPTYPNVKGIKECKTLNHSAIWNDKIDYNNKVVGIIGNGSSGVQITEGLFKKYKWILSSKNRKISKLLFQLLKQCPFYHSLYRLYNMIILDITLISLFFNKGRDKAHNQIINSHQSKINIPTYPVGCNRIIVCFNQPDILNSNKITLIYDKINEINDNQIITIENTYNVDHIVCATGFNTFLIPTYSIKGIKGIEIKNKWNDIPNCYKGIHVNGFPNMHFLYGPWTNTLLGSITQFVECQLLEGTQCDSMEVKKQYEDEWTNLMLKWSNSSPFNEKCPKWQNNKNDININNYPNTQFSFQCKSFSVDKNAYEYQ